MAKTPHKELNLLDLFPVRIVDWEREQDGTVCLKKPKVRNHLLKSIIKRLGKSLHYQIHLDDFGSFVWERCDGNQRVEQIAESLRQKFGDKVEPVYERLAAFVKMMAYQKVITYKGISDNIK